jgi:RimJ/RimL family protein N-acetyltransferase
LTPDELRVLGVDDVDLVVEATRAETGPALWGPRPAGPYTPADADAALRAWSGGQVSYGVFEDGRLVAAVGVMPSGDGVAEVAYWVRPEARGRGVATGALRAATERAHAEGGGRPRLWLEIRPDNAASLRVAERAGYVFDRREPDHCRDAGTGAWHDCLIWIHEQ